ncbi:MAG: Phage head-tail joining protein [Pelotomaculum sp. PtaB.Bin104]|nr:MAG: Phage head-tail joining protein [Pelotomaculum sp. PtaB.Bin104]
MRAGELRHRITIQEPVETLDSLKTPVLSWQDVATVWAAVEPLRGREYLEVKNTNTELSARIRIRYRRGINPSMRVKYGSRIFNIESVIDFEERHREIHLMCSEVFE